MAEQTRKEEVAAQVVREEEYQKEKQIALVACIDQLTKLPPDARFEVLDSLGRFYHDTRAYR